MLLQQGDAAEQRVPQLYVHLVPRRKDDLPNNDEIYPLLESSAPLPDADGKEDSAKTVAEGHSTKRLAGSAVREWMLQLAADKNPAPCGDSSR